VKDKLVLTLSFTTVFALGCATASVLVTTAGAEPPPAGQEQCIGLLVIGVVNLDHADAEAKIAERAKNLPPGWRAVGGSYDNGRYSVLACRGSI
jgi:hypothetical protein